MHFLNSRIPNIKKEIIPMMTFTVPRVIFIYNL